MCINYKVSTWFIVLQNYIWHKRHIWNNGQSCSFLCLGQVCNVLLSFENVAPAWKIMLIFGWSYNLLIIFYSCQCPGYSWCLACVSFCASRHGAHDFCSLSQVPLTWGPYTMLTKRYVFCYTWDWSVSPGHWFYLSFLWFSYADDWRTTDSLVIQLLNVATRFWKRTAENQECP